MTIHLLLFLCFVLFFPGFTHCPPPPPPSLLEAPITGYMFGKGIYFADMVSKNCHKLYRWVLAFHGHQNLVGFSEYKGDALLLTPREIIPQKRVYVVIHTGPVNSLSLCCCIMSILILENIAIRCGRDYCLPRVTKVNCITVQGLTL